MLSGVFDGRPDALTFSHFVRLLSDNLYRTAGRWTAMSLMQGGPGPDCMAEAIYCYWTGLPVSDEHLSIDLVVDVDLRQHIQQMSLLISMTNAVVTVKFALLYVNVIAGVSGKVTSPPKIIL